jgi:hypothetical protein
MMGRGTGIMSQYTGTKMGDMSAQCIILETKKDLL